MPSRASIAPKSRLLALLALGCAGVLVAVFLGRGFASAGASGSPEASFGLSGSASVEIPPVEEQATVSKDAPLSDEAAPSEAFVLETTASRDISSSVSDLEAQLEAERIAAEEAQRAHDAECEARGSQNQANAVAQGCSAASAVDFSIGHEAFVEQWGSRIDAYLAGSALAGYGATFAEAAWEYGVDPRFSPAISNTESTKGQNCFRPYNAWGWMGGNWSSWSESIYAHVRGLADGYGFTLTMWAAQKYCPPTYSDWYAKTAGEFPKI